MARDHGVMLRVVESVISCNDSRIDTMLAKIKSAVGGEFAERVITLLGLTFKPNTDDLRESPAMAILHRLITAGATVRVFDPQGMALAVRDAPERAVFCEDEYDAAAGSDCLVIATEWNQFRGLDLERIKGALRRPVVVDLRNIYEPDSMRALGFSYTGVGRAAEGGS
jgi:UDPglucose 6-dehydrogenase